jgi:hypothetical protein
VPSPCAGDGAVLAATEQTSGLLWREESATVLVDVDTLNRMPFSRPKHLLVLEIP